MKGDISPLLGLKKRNLKIKTRIQKELMTADTN